MDNTVYVPSTSNDGFLGGGGIGSLLIGALLFGGGLGGFGGANRWGANGAAAGAVATDIVLNPAFQSLQNQISNLSNSVENNQIIAGITSVNQNISNTTRDIIQGQGITMNAVTNGNFTTLNSINGLGRDITAANTQALINQIQNFNTTNGLVTNSTNQIIAQGSSLSAQLAACCCETQKQILADGNATRALINQLDKENLQAQLTDAKGQVSNSTQTNAIIAAMAQQTNVILQHLIPNNKSNS